MRVILLGSSSQGNCALLETDETRVLVDVGFSGRQIESRLAGVGYGVEDVHAVFVTHEHSDHVAGLRGLARYAHLEFFANAPTARACQSGLERPLPWRLFESGQAFAFRDLRVETVRLPHDAYDPVGYLFCTGGFDSLFNPYRSVAWLTDMGHVPAGAHRLASAAQAIILEANHDPDLLEGDLKRPFSVKQRIRGRHGHLSNGDARRFVDELGCRHLRHLCLGHLSRDCNRRDLVATTFSGLPDRLTVRVVDPESEAPVVVELD